MAVTVNISGKKTHEIICVKNIPYAFKDEKSGKNVQGETCKVCFLEYTDGILSGMFICKAISGFSPALKVQGTLTFDRYGKANGFNHV